jgi:hypothetical protein
MTKGEEHRKRLLRYYDRLETIELGDIVHKYDRRGLIERVFDRVFPIGIREVDCEVAREILEKRGYGLANKVA